MKPIKNNFYLLKTKFGKYTIGLYDEANYGGMVGIQGCFYLCGSDDSFILDDFIIVRKIEIPEEN